MPLKDTLGEPVYKTGLEPDYTLRKSLSQKYLTWFHQAISTEITHSKTFMLDGHSTLTAHGVADNQIELMNFQNSSLNEEPTYFSPDVLIEAYANELSKKLSWVSITVNESSYDNVYGHVCGEHSVNAMTRVGNKVPAILQETNQKLYLNTDRTPNIEALETLRRAFAEALRKMAEKLPLSS